MQITSVDIWTVVVPTIPGRVHSPECVPETGWDQMAKHIIRLNTDTEHAGIGETGRGVALDDVRAGAGQLLGRNPEHITLQDIFSTRSDGSEEELDTGSGGPSYAAFEMAVYDLMGRILERPVHALLGGAVRDRVRADYWMGHQTVEDGKRSVARALEQGFKGIKIKCKIEEPMVARLQGILEVGGPEFKVTVDPNERFHTAEQAIALAAELELLGNVEVFEDPIPKSDMDGYIRIHEEINLPVAMHLGGAPQILAALKAQVVDCFNLGGGLVGFMQNGAIAASAGFRCWHGSGNDLGIVDTAYIHSACVVPNCTMASDFVGGWTREDDLIVEPIVFRDGYVETPMKPGLGCELDLIALERYQQSAETHNA